MTYRIPVKRVYWVAEETETYRCWSCNRTWVSYSGPADCECGSSYCTWVNSKKDWYWDEAMMQFRRKK